MQRVREEKEGERERGRRERRDRGIGERAKEMEGGRGEQGVHRKSTKF